MSDAPSPKAPRASVSWLIGGAALGAAALGAVALARSSDSPTPAHVCPDAVAFVWDRDSAWLDEWTARASGARAIVQRDLESWSTRWTDAHTEACALTETNRDTTLQCLDAQAARGHALASVLSELDASARPGAWSAGVSLPPAEDCGPALPPGGRLSDPDAVAVLHRAQAWLDVGQPAKARALAESLDLTDDDPLRSGFRWIRGHDLPRHDAIALWQRALADAIAADNPTHAFNVALELARATPPGEGTASAQRWWSLASAFARRLPTTPDRQHMLLSVQAELQMAHGRPDAALKVLEPALTLFESEHGRNHPGLVPGLRRSSVAAALLGKLDAAERLAERAREIGDSALGAKHPESLATLETIATALRDAGAPERATGWLRMAAERRPPQDRGEVLVSLGETYLQARRFGDAADTFERAKTWALEHEDPSLDLRLALGRAAVARARGDAQTAAEHLDDALKKPLGPRDRVALRLRRADVLMEAERWADAQTSIASALNDAAKIDDATLGAVLSAGADIAQRTGRPDDAITLARRAVARLASAHGTHHASVLVALTRLGTACLDRGRNEDAAAAFARAAELASTAELDVRVAAELGWATALWRVGQRDHAAELVRALHDDAVAAERAAPAADAAAWLSQRGLALAAPQSTSQH